MRREERARKLGVPVDQLPDGRGKHGNHSRGAEHPRWQGGIALSDQGYIRVQVGAEHPLADPNGYAYLHQLVWLAAQAERPADLVVHHVDRDKLNNRLSNLQGLSAVEHAAHHMRERVRDGQGRLT